MNARPRADVLLQATVALMAGFGLAMVYSASSVQSELRHAFSGYTAVRQAGWAVLSFILLIVLQRVDYRRFNHPAWVFGSLGFVVMMLVAVFFADPKDHRWFRIPNIGSLQPSEFAKPAVVLFLAFFVSQRSRAINAKGTWAPAAVTIAIVSALVVLGDYGTALVLVIPAFIIFFVAGLRWQYLTLALAIMMAASVVAVVSKPYRLARVIAYLDPTFQVLDRVPYGGAIRSYVGEQMSGRDTTYQQRQSRIAVGSGGIFGLGLMQSRQKMSFLPEAQNDFIYAVIAEELGLWGSSAVLIGFVVILWRGLRLFWLAPDEFGRYLALGLTLSIVAQAFINMSVVLDLGPTKGFPLPLISQGGCSLLATMASVGILLSISEHAS
jgi:cell division protein FtsW